MLVVGKREAEETTVSLRRLGGQQQQVLPLTEAVGMLANEAVPPDRKRAAREVATAA
jgi:threonyl-tRNA synthetase